MSGIQARNLCCCVQANEMVMDRIQLQASYKYFVKVIHIIGEWIGQIYLTQPDIRLYLNYGNVIRYRLNISSK